MRQFNKKDIKTISLVLLLAISSGRISNAQYTKLLDFVPAFGVNPVSGLVLNGTTLYGMTFIGDHAGDLFKININGTGLQSITLLENGGLDNGPAIFQNGNLYVTDVGGEHGGAVMKASSTEDTHSVIHSFTSVAAPVGSLAISGNVLYGVTELDGANKSGTIYKLNTDGTGFTVIANLPTSRTRIMGSPVVSNNIVYVPFQGSFDERGAIYKVNTDGTNFKTIMTFDTKKSNPTGAYPSCLIVYDNTIYGTTLQGGANDPLITRGVGGTLFKINIDGTGYQTLVNFGDSKGTEPVGLTLVGNVLYGVTKGVDFQQGGTLFSVNTDGTGFVKLFDFDVDNNQSGIHGSRPVGNPVFFYNVLYGMTEDGGSLNDGTIYQFTLPVRVNQTITFNPLPSKVYGDADFALSATASSNLPVTYTSSNQSIATIVNNNVHIVHAGTVNIIAHQSGNSFFNTAPDKSQALTINRKEVKATADNASKTFGSASPAFTITYTGFVSPDSKSNAVVSAPATSTTATTASPVGNYPIALSGGSVTSNYQLTLVNGALSVNQKTVTATADSKSRVFGTANPSFTITYSGFISPDSKANALISAPAISNTATNASNVGTYPITLSGGSVTSNYKLVLVDGTLTINRKIVTARADNKTKTFGSPNPPLTVTITGFNGPGASIAKSPTATTTATATSPVGTYPIILSGGGVPSNFQLVLVNGTLTVTPATVAASMNKAADITTADIKDIPAEYKVYPNPTGDLIHIESANSQISRVEFININGQVVKSEAGNSERAISIDISGMAIGLYTLKIYDSTGITLSRIMKQ